jgi:ABC-2 type transport system ATP-binding protein
VSRVNDAITVEQLSKRYPNGVTAVDTISFAVPHQEIFGFLGPNGAGKSTTIKILATLVHPTGGKALIDGHDVTRERDWVRQHIGLVFQDPTLDDRLTAWENLLFHGMIYGISAAEVRRRGQPLLEMVGLADRANHPVRTFSGGMRRRLELARGLIHRPTVLFLDEPTVGLDPQTRAQIWDYVLNLSRNEGVTIFMTTHYMEEAEYCQRIAIMDHGHLVALDTPDGLKRTLGEEVLELTFDSSSSREQVMRDLPGEPAAVGDRELRLVAPDAASVLARAAGLAGPRLVRATIHRPTLDDVFLSLTGREIRDEQVSAREQWRRWGGRMARR